MRWWHTTHGAIALMIAVPLLMVVIAVSVMGFANFMFYPHDTTPVPVTTTTVAVPPPIEGVTAWNG